MIDREARNRMSQAIQSYMAEETTAFQLDDMLAKIKRETRDKTVKQVGEAMWFHYDDCQNHKIAASKEEWDYFNRLRLLLESDAEIATVRAGRAWGPCEAIAAVCFATFIVMTAHTGWGQHLFIYALPFGPLSMALSWIRAREREVTTSVEEIATTPFRSIGSLLAVRRRVPIFARRRYPQSLQQRAIRGPIMSWLIYLPTIVLWCMCSPVVLFVQMLPERTSATRVVMNGQDLETQGGAAPMSRPR